MTLTSPPGGECLEIALTVESLRQAENLYTRLFGMRPAGGIGSEGNDAAPDEPTAARRSVLEREGLRIVLRFGVVYPPSTGRIEHIGLCLPEPELDRLRGDAGELACRILTDSAGCLVLEDPLGVRWSLTGHSPS